MENQTAPVTPKQIGEGKRRMEQAIINSGQDRDGLQRAFGSKEFDPGLVELLTRLGNPVNPYESQITKQAWFYPKGLIVPTLEIQAGRILKVHGIELKWAEDAQNMPVPTGADGIGIFPLLSALGKHLDITDPRGRGYGEVIMAVCDAINASPDMAPLNNYRKDELDARYVRIHAEVLEMIEFLEKEAEKKGYNALVMPVNLGDWGTGDCYSPLNARWQMLNLPPKRLPIEPVAGWSLLTGISERLTAWEQLFGDFTGAEYNWVADGRWSFSLYARFNDGKLEFFADDADFAYDYSGAFAGFPGVSELAA